MEERLYRNAGVRPSRPWLSACLRHLGLSEGDMTSTSDVDDNVGDQVLHQILHTDLRSVVRCTLTDERTNEGSPAGEEDGRSTLLRRAISQSSRALNQPQTAARVSHKAILPEGFRHMVQVEEILDVSLNAEQRLTLGPASNNTPTAVGNQNRRCLKLLLSDGYYGDGGCIPSTNDANAGPTDATPIHPNSITSIVAMETVPIQTLSVHSKPGIKLILQGPLTIQVGVLMLNPSNAIVLGGCIPYLIPIQRKALEQAAKVAGAGVDPTIKALIGNTEIETEEVEDEGDHESRDIEHVAQVEQNTGPINSSVPDHNIQIDNNADMPQQHTLEHTFRGTVNADADDELRRHTDEDLGNCEVQEECHETISAQTTGINLDRTEDTHSGICFNGDDKDLVSAVRSEPLSYTDLYSLLDGIIKDESRYVSFTNTTFVVPCKMKDYLEFNIEKTKEWKKGDKSKYGYTLSCTMDGPNAKGTYITCKLHNRIVEPFMGMTAGEMRKLKKTNKERCTQIVGEAGEEVLSSLSELASWKLKLIHPFSKDLKKKLDEKDPILLVVDRG